VRSPESSTRIRLAGWAPGGERLASIAPASNRRARERSAWSYPDFWADVQRVGADPMLAVNHGVRPAAEQTCAERNSDFEPVARGILGAGMKVSVAVEADAAYFEHGGVRQYGPGP